MIPWLPVQKVNGNSATAAGPIEAMFPGLAGQNVNGKSAPAVGPIESMVPWLPGQKVNGNSAPAVDPTETMVPRLHGQKGCDCRLHENHGPDQGGRTRSNTLNALRRLAELSLSFHLLGVMYSISKAMTVLTLIILASFMEQGRCSSQSQLFIDIPALADLGTPL